MQSALVLEFYRKFSAEKSVADGSIFYINTAMDALHRSAHVFACRALIALFPIGISRTARCDSIDHASSISARS